MRIMEKLGFTILSVISWPVLCVAIIGYGTVYVLAKLIEVWGGE